ncbi:MAG: hypothetical protein CSA62_10060 [Planctomycetota bacterium]|nr:MAG: hypothetical protein CSA62_10060 [Planctomycetota bacterium]
MSHYLCLLPLAFGISISLLGAQGKSLNPKSLSRPKPQVWNDYWRQGKAELTRFALEQSRYGETRKGDAVQIFVVEDFRTDKQVKAEKPRPDAVPVMKLNFTRKFLTGIYPYSAMTSVFTPLALKPGPGTLKLSCSVQEWCGQVWLQLNMREAAYRLIGHSYYEAEGEEKREFPLVHLEDGIWNRVRIAPWTLPVGSFKAAAGALFSRLRHEPLAPVKALGQLVVHSLASSSAPRILAYTVKMPSLRRSLQIRFQGRFPFRIVGFRESLPNGRRNVGVATHRELIAYWRHKDAAGALLRKRLGLDPKR